MGARSSKLGVGIYFLPLLVPFLLSSVLVAVSSGGTVFYLPSHEELEMPEGQKKKNPLSFHFSEESF